MERFSHFKFIGAMLGFIKNFVFLLLIFSVTGCMSAKLAKYTKPDHQSYTKEYKILLKKPFEQVWTELNKKIPDQFLNVTDSKKDIGVLTVSFSSVKPEKYITGEQWIVENPTASFSGDYVDFVTTHRNGKLNGIAHISIIRVSPDLTEVNVNIQYVFEASNIFFHNTWKFATGNCSTLEVGGKTSGTEKTRTICPTYKAENEILTKVKAISDPTNNDTAAFKPTELVKNFCLSVGKYSSMIFDLRKKGVSKMEAEKRYLNSIPEKHTVTERIDANGNFYLRRRICVYRYRISC